MLEIVHDKDGGNKSEKISNETRIEVCSAFMMLAATTTTTLSLLTKKSHPVIGMEVVYTAS